MHHHLRRCAPWLLAGVALVAMASPARSQDSVPARPRPEAPRERMRERFADRIRQDLKLTDDQMQRLRATVATFAGRRRELERRQGDLKRALSDELQPGAAGPADSLGRLTDDLVTLRLRYAETFRDEQKELAKYLDPVQRAQLTLLRERLMNRARDLHGRHPPLERRMDH